MICRVEVVGFGGIFSCKCIDLLCFGDDIERLSLGSDVFFSALEALSNLLIRETILLCLKHHSVVNVTKRFALHGIICLHNILTSTKEPVINLGDVVDLGDRQRLLIHSLSDGKDTAVGRVGKLRQYFFVSKLELGRIARVGWIDHANSLLQRLFQGAPNTHNFTNTLHGRANVGGNTLEFRHVPTGDLGHDVIQTRLKACLSLLGDGILNFVQWNTERKLGGHKCKRVTCGFGC
mmetsp:Transcript_11413/g.18908  ORF Transcript_11413/g.18908 Transcript_11413/m.18908 type:complete len:235 (-) Transcript_11413:1461-2165(-)